MTFRLQGNKCNLVRTVLPTMKVTTVRQKQFPPALMRVPTVQKYVLGENDK